MLGPFKLGYRVYPKKGSATFGRPRHRWPGTPVIEASLARSCTCAIPDWFLLRASGPVGMRQSTTCMQRQQLSLELRLAEATAIHRACCTQAPSLCLADPPVAESGQICPVLFVWQQVCKRSKRPLLLILCVPLRPGEHHLVGHACPSCPVVPFFPFWGSGSPLKSTNQKKFAPPLNRTA